MNWSISPNTQAILLLTAPLIVGRGQPSVECLTPGEYKKLARRLRDLRRQPSDLLGTDAVELLAECQSELNIERIKRLLYRGLQLSQAVEHWRTRAIWVLSRADPEYPVRLKSLLKEDAPSILYGCGEINTLSAGGLAIVGSRNVNDALIEYTERVGRLAAAAHHTVVSGGARGIDHAAMRGALVAGGKVAGVLADSLEKAAMNHEYRSALMDQRLTLISPYDPNAGFNVGNAMQRNKLIYALATAALIVNSDFQKGGTWAGAVEQLDKLKLVTVYVRWTGDLSSGMEALRKKGALPWPEPATPEAFAAALIARNPFPTDSVIQDELAFAAQTPSDITSENMPVVFEPPAAYTPHSSATERSAAEVLFATVRELLLELLRTPMKEEDVASMLQITGSQAKQWLQRLVDEEVLEKQSRPVRYTVKETTLFDNAATVRNSESCTPDAPEIRRTSPSGEES
jgi:predicted Rossmann fold nucleotide-binding protein DprA/Smf involved in DNA uptake